MIKRILLAVLLTLLFSSSASALTVEDVIYLSSAGVEDSIIIAKIEASGVAFRLTTEEIVMLWEAGVSATVIEYMIGTSADVPGELDYDDEEYYEEYASDDDVIVVRHPRTRVHLYFGFGYYDDWYYPYWYSYRPYSCWSWPFYCGTYFSYWHSWPYYYYWSPYAYYYPWDCWAYRHGGHAIAARGMRHHWRRTPYAKDTYGGRSGYRLKPTYSYTSDTRRGGYLGRDGRYVFPRGKPGDGYMASRGYRKPYYGDRYRSEYGGKTYRSDRYRLNRERADRYFKSRAGRRVISKDKRYYQPRSQRPTRDQKSSVGRSRGSRGDKPTRSSVRSSRSRSGGSRSSVQGSRSSGSRSSARGSSGSSGSRSSRGGRKR